MSIEYIKGNLLDFTGVNVIAHSINTIGVMGGLAGQIKDEYPQVYQDVQESVKNHQNILGNFVVTTLTTGKKIVSLYTQSEIGTDSRKVDYESLYVSLETLEKILREKSDKYSLALPMNLSCGLAGGSWKIVESMISKIFLDSPVRVVIVEYVRKNKKLLLEDTKENKT